MTYDRGQNSRFIPFGARWPRPLLSGSSRSARRATAHARIVSRSEPRLPARGGLMSPAEAFSTSIFFDSTARQYAAAIAATLFALLIAAAMMPVSGGYMVYLVLPAAVAFSAVYCGLGPSVVAIAVALFGVRYWFINPSHSLSIPDGPQSIGILAFVVVSVVVVAIGERNRANIEALRQSLGK